MTKVSNIAALEALLFLHGEPVSFKKILDILKIDSGECIDALSSLEEKLQNDSESGVALLKTQNSYQLVTKPELHNINLSLIKEEFKEQLTPAALETISIIAYLGPIPRSTIEYVRGINSTYILRNLLMRGLVERISEKRKLGYQYIVTPEFMKHIRIQKIEELPEYEKYSSVLKKFEFLREENV